VQWRELVEALDLYQNLSIDAYGLPKLLTPVHHSVTDSVH
jgi:hypothetical protein